MKEAFELCFRENLSKNYFTNLDVVYGFDSGIVDT